MAQIDALMQALNELRTHKDYDKFKMELSAEDLDVLVNRIYEYTIRLAENNNISLEEEEQTKITGVMKVEYLFGLRTQMCTKRNI